MRRDVHDVIEAAVGGRVATEIYEGERRFQAVVRYPEHLRNSVGRYPAHPVDRPPMANRFRWAAWRELSCEKGFRRSSARWRSAASLLASTYGIATWADSWRSCRRKCSSKSAAAGYYYEWGGQFENMQRARRHLMIIVPITIGAIFFLLFLLFRSLRFAALIILVLPFASIGGVAALYFSRRVFSVPASVGFIALWGIAVLNGVVLVSYIRSLREAGMDRRQAIIEGAKLRFRPVMMTATVAALASCRSCLPPARGLRCSGRWRLL